MLEILSQVGVPPFIAGIIQGSGTTAPDQINVFKSLAVKPIQQIISSRVNRKIIKQLFQGVKLTYNHNPVDSLDANYVSMLDERDLRNQIRTVNEVRASRGLHKVKWGDQPIIPFSNAAIAKLPAGSGEPAEEEDNNPDGNSVGNPDGKNRKKKKKKKKKDIKE